MSDDDTTTDDTTTDDTTTDASWFPEDWRQQIAGDDDKALAQLGRYKTPTDIWNKSRALEQRISSGELKEISAYPAEGSDEDKAAWREANGVPMGADKYTLSKEIEQSELEELTPFFEWAHGENMPNDVVDKMVGFFYETGQQQEGASAEADKARAQAAEDALRGEWGNDYRGHMNRIDALLDMVEEGQGDSILDARMPDGSKIRDSKIAMNFLLEAALNTNPATTLTADGVGTIDTIETELNQIRDVMRTDRKKYDRDEGMQNRFRQLLEAKEKHERRQGAAA